MKRFYQLCCAACMVMCLTFTANAQNTHYVKADATGANNGSSWVDAFTSLQSALDAAASGDQIWVSTGTYKPSKDVTGSETPSDERTKTFLLKNGVSVYGGFAGNEATLAERNSKWKTILNGDSNGDDGADFSNTGENVYHVVAASGLTASVVFDGFTIVGGNADKNTAFLSKTQGNYYGGGIIALGSGTYLTISNCVFASNSALIGGGLYANNTSSPELTDVVLEGNRANAYGGGIGLENSSLTIFNSVLTHNAAGYGGAISINGGSPTIVNCTITGNTAATRSGGLEYTNSSSMVIRNSILWGNTATSNADLFAGNTAAISYSDVGGGYAGDGNTDADPLFAGASNGKGADGTWMTADDGLALLPASPCGNAGNNAGIPSGITTDLIGNPRVLNLTVNMGAYETVNPATIYVNKNAGGTNTGASWTNAFTDLQSALEAAVSGDRIWVAAGTYKPGKDESGNGNPSDARTKTFLLKSGVKVYGGFAGTETSLSARNIRSNATILSGDLDGNDDNTFSNHTNNAYHVVVAKNPTEATVLDGFTIRGGNANNPSSFAGFASGNLYGGGIFSFDGENNLTIENCVMKENTGHYGGGASVYSPTWSATPRFVNCSFVNNKAASIGGGLYHFNGAPVVIGCVFYNNQAYQGGGSYSLNSGISFFNCTFVGNNASDNGGGIFVNSNYSFTIKNSIVWNNTGGGTPGIAGGTPSATYSNLQGGISGTGNINSDPGFARILDGDGPDNIFGTTDDGLALRTTSPSADAGSNADIPEGITTDVTGAGRIQHSTVNMGAYETPVSSVIHYVKASATGANNGSAWADAFTSLQDALDAAVSGDQIWVAGNEMYRPSKDINGNASPADPRTKTFLLKNGVSLYGGFSGTESTLADRAGLVTLLTGDLAANDNWDDASKADNVYHVVVANTLTVPVVFDGLIVGDGNANRSNSYLVNTSSATIANDAGAGFVIITSGTNLTISNCIFNANQSTYRGGALLSHHSAPTVTNSFFYINKSGLGGGIMDVFPSGAKYINCVIADNEAVGEGGGIYTLGSGSSAEYINCTIARNTASSNGGGIYNKFSNLVIKNSIIWDNTGGDTPGLLSETNTTTVSYSDVQGGYAGAGNINADPKFYRQEPFSAPEEEWILTKGNLILLSSSPAANAGSNAAVPAQITTDVLGDSRILNTTVNMGAFERLTTEATITLSNTTATFNGFSLGVTATTNPVGLNTVSWYTRDGVWVEPVEAGTYQVQTFIFGEPYGGSVRGTFTIEKAPVTLSLSSLNHTYDGTAKTAQASTTPSDKTVNITYEKDGVAVAAPTDAGAYTVHVVVDDPNYQGSAIGTLTIGKAAATVTLGSLNHTYDGTTKIPQASTTPSGKTVKFTYEKDGVAVAAPIHAGVYTVYAAIDDANYQGTATGTLTIGKSVASLTLGSLSQVYDGTFKTATALSTSPLTGEIAFAYKQGATVVAQPVNAGSYEVTATINDADYEGTATGVLVISRANAGISFSGLIQEYDGTPKTASAASEAVTDGAIALTYRQNGNEVQPVDAGEYSVTAVIDDLNYKGNATATLVITKANASIFIENLSYTYDGTVKYAQATTSPAGKNIELVYSQDGIAVSQPMNAGDYTVTATIVDTNYQGTATATLTIGKATGTITLGGLSHIYDGTAKVPTVIAVPDVAGELTASYKRDGVSVTSAVDAGTYTVTAGFNSLNYSFEPVTATLTISKADQTISFGSLPVKAAGDAPFNLTATASSALPVRFLSGNSNIASINGTQVTPVAPGTVTITALQEGNNNYHAASATQTLVVTKAAQVITFGPLPEKILGEEPFRLNASSTSGLSVHYASDNASVAVIEGDLVKLVGAGEVTITASQEGNEFYAAAIPVTQILTVKLVTATEASSNEIVRAYPNPATDYIFVEGCDLSKGEAFTLVDVAGKTAPVSSSGSGGLLTLHVNGLAPGIYLLKVHTLHQGTITTRILKR